MMTGGVPDAICALSCSGVTRRVATSLLPLDDEPARFQLVSRKASRIHDAQRDRQAECLPERGAQPLADLRRRTWAGHQLDLERQGGTFLFGYEEALGYCVGRAVRDKDGIGAAAVLAELAGLEAAADRNLLDRLDSIHRRFGLFVTKQISLLLPGAEGQRQIRDTVARLRSNPPTELGGRKLLVFSDLVTGLVLDRRTGQTAPSPLPPSDVLQLELESDARVTLRPSGTEPKLKVYVELREEVAPGEDLASVRARAAGALGTLEGAVRKLL